jgi:hypothetical protein
MRNLRTKLGAKLGAKLDRFLYTDVMERDLYRAGKYLLLGGKILGIGRYYPIIKLHMKVPRISVWYTNHIGLVNYRKLRIKREYIKQMARERMPTKKEREIMKAYKANFARIQAEGRNA